LPVTSATDPSRPCSTRSREEHYPQIVELMAHQGSPLPDYVQALTLRKPNPLVLRKLDPLNAHLQVNILLLLVENFVCCEPVNPVGEKPESVVSLWVTGMLSIRLSTRPEGLGLVRRTSPFKVREQSIF